MFEYKSCGLNGVFLTNGYRQHRYGDDVAIAIEDLNGLHRLLTSEIINKDAPMTGSEFRFLRTEMDLSQKQLARLLGNEDQTIAKWEKGQTKGGVPQWADAIIRDLAMREILGQDSEMRTILEALTAADRHLRVQKLWLEHNQHWRVADSDTECAYG